METTPVLTRTKWTLDPSHSEIGFKVKHLMLTNVRGVFNKYNCTVYTKGEDFSSADIELSISTGSISTDDTNRDNHLRSSDFFDAENFKEINFKSTSLEKISGGAYVLHGDLTIKGISKRIKLNVGFNGIVKDPYGNTKAGFEITGKIYRTDFGLTWNAVLETGGVMVSDGVTINCEIQLVQQPESELNL
jgi:polyisoprenoid-binding protein YceI